MENIFLLKEKKNKIFVANGGDIYFIGLERTFKTLFNKKKNK